MDAAATAAWARGIAGENVIMGGSLTQGLGVRGNVK